MKAELGLIKEKQKIFTLVKKTNWNWKDNPIYTPLEEDPLFFSHNKKRTPAKRAKAPEPPPTSLQRLFPIVTKFLAAWIFPSKGLANVAEHCVKDKSTILVVKVCVGLSFFKWVFYCSRAEQLLNSKLSLSIHSLDLRKADSERLIPVSSQG